MARYTGPACRLCRREGIKLYLKGDRCLTDKCAFSRRKKIPGQHADARSRKISEYGKQLREKQKVKRIYGVLERQFSRYFEISDKKEGETGENLLKMLEKRLDNVIYRCGFAVSRRQARQIVLHGKVLVNGKKINIPSYQVRVGEKISLTEDAQNFGFINQSLENRKNKSIPTWIEMNFDKKEAVIKSEPTRRDIDIQISEQLIVELYSK